MNEWHTNRSFANTSWTTIESTTAATFEVMKEAMQIAVLVASAILTFLALYLTTSLCFYMRLTERRSSLNRSGSTKCIIGGSRRTEKFGRTLRWLCVGTAAFTLVMTLVGLSGVVSHYLRADLFFCLRFAKSHHGLRSFNEILLNSILWLRQKIFYMHPAMRQISSIRTSVVSWLFYVIMVAATLFSLVIFIVGGSLGPESGSNLCIVNAMGTFDEKWTSGILGLTLTLIIIYRLLFLGLLLYPLIKHGRKSLRSGDNNAPSELIAIIRRIFVADCLCIAIFVVVTVLNDHLSKQSIFLRTVLWEVELVLGFIFIMLSFTDCKCRLFPFCFKPTARRKLSSRQSTGRVSVWSTAN